MDSFNPLDRKHLENIFNRIIDMAENYTNDTEKYTSPSKIREIYKKLCQLSDLTMERDWELRYLRKAAKVMRTLTHLLLERCYWIQYGDSEMVCDLLKKLFETDGHLGKIFTFQQLCATRENMTVHSCGKHFQTTWSENALANEQVQPFHYFMKHCNKMKTFFSGQRLFDICFVQGMHFHTIRNSLLTLPPASRMFISPEILVTFLQYGLFSNSKPDEDGIGKLLTGAIGIIISSNQSHYEVYTLRIIKVANVLLRAVPHVRKSSLLKDQNLSEGRNKYIEQIVQQMSAPNLLPQLKTRCTGPQELQHLCRITIRRALYEKWMLPEGIVFLPLPTIIKNYINLMYD